MGVVTFLLLAFATLVLGQDDSVSRCSGVDVTGLKDALRRSSCKLAPGGNETAAEAFRAYVRAKHGGGTYPYFGFANLFRLSTSKVWCRHACGPSVAAENITWCINIPYQDRDVETCIRLGADQEVVTNSTCEAESVGIPQSLSLPSNCKFYGGVGCLGLINLDWFFEASYLTCTVHTDTCYSKSFTSLLVQTDALEQPEFEVFPSSTVEVLTSDRLVLHMEVSTTTDRIAAFWQHGNTAYKTFIFGDPFCNDGIEQCQNDTHPDAQALLKERVRIYRTTRVITLDGCQTATIYRLESYLIIDNVTELENGEYTFNMTITADSYPSITDARSANVSIGCHQHLIPQEVKCSQELISVDKGSDVVWACGITGTPSLNFSLIFNKTATVPSSMPSVSCGKELAQVIFVVEEDPVHVCYSSYTVSVRLCSADYNVTGEYSVVNSTGHAIPGAKFDVKLVEEPPIHPPSKEDSVRSTVLYAAPLAALTASSIAILVVLLLALRCRKRKRDRRMITRVQSPSLKEVSFLKEEADQGLLSPMSPVNGNLCDPLEFPRSRLYIYSNKVLGEGSFGRVLQAKAEGIVPGIPERNIVAIKTTKENATSIEREELLAELELMRTMEPHENILNLLGQCTTGGGPVCLIVEFASYGNLRDFLRQCEEVVLSLNHLPHIPRNRSRTRTLSTSSCGSNQPLITRQDSVFTPSNGHTHFVFPSPTGQVSSTSSSNGDQKLTAHHPETAAVPLAHSVAPIGHDYINTKGLVYMEDVHNFALQIACGLDHLASMQIVHCDLAARNVLIAEGFVLKIADFGLARDISGSEMYKKNPRGKIPVKWTAPEALEKRVFTVKSDVWSYGVLLWELFTYGHTPYPEVNLGHSYEAFISFLKAGNRMQQPDNCPATFYELMLECWHLDPNLRPTPHDIVARLTPTDSIFDDADSEVNGGGPLMNSKITTSGAGHQSSQE